MAVNLMLRSQNKVFMNRILFLLIIFSHSAFSSEANDIKKLMNKYLSALNQKNETLITEITSKKYFKLLKKENNLKKTFAKTKTQSKKTFYFDMIYKKAAVDKNLFLVNIKDRKMKDYGEYWYLVKYQDGKYIIDDMKFLD